MLNEQEIFTINIDNFKDEYGNLKDLNIYPEVFDSLEEQYSFFEALHVTFPEGVPKEYLFQKMESYHQGKLIKALDDMALDGYVVMGYNDDGEETWTITDSGREFLSSYNQ